MNQAPPNRPNELQAALLTLTNTQTQFMTETRSSIRNLETQVGQLANMLNNRAHGNLPCNTEVNPKEQVQAITLRSGKQIEQSSVQQSAIQNKELAEKSDTIWKEVTEDHQKVFKKLHINIPFGEALEQMPSYVKFMKKFLSKKRKMEDYETVVLTEECSVILQRKLSQKRLGLGEARPTTVTLQLADRSVKHPRGIIEDVLLRVDTFIFPANFIVLDMEEDMDVPIILGRPFLATGQALIDVQKGELKLRDQGDEVVLNVFKAMKYPVASDSCYCVDVIEKGVSKRRVSSAALEAVLTSGEVDDDDAETREYGNWINSYQPYRKKFEELAEGPERPLTSILQPPQLELKALPNH
ncbi:uncharacterized protein LOC133799609 [Humulus lupulus]|uniref:uncharacterized protein LOC133799609 n=1 Tax=Humulus lupulus TaxID=3486 RepID=UPI002B406CCD|nr:uncharacterized protein LOC133799609 [Humulus lupulus]